MGYTLHSIASNLFPLITGAKLIKTKSPLKRTIEWLLLIFTQFQSLIPLLSLIMVSRALINGKVSNGLEFYLLIWSCFELEFMLYCYVLYNRLAPIRLANPIPQLMRFSLLDRILDYPEGLSNLLTQWFLPRTKDKKLQYNHITNFLSWSFFDSNLNDLDDNSRSDMQELIDYAAKKVSSNFIDVDNIQNESDVGPCMMLNHDPLIVQHKPLLTYLTIGAFKLLGRAGLYLIGFKRFTLPNNPSIRYWIYQPKLANDQQNPPIFFLHGIGVGLLMYLGMIKQMLKQDLNRSMILMEIPYISLSISSEVPSVKDTLEGIDTIMKFHNIRKCTWVAHSYGTLLATWVVKHRPQFVHKLMLIDPVCFQVWEPSLIYNFLYSPPQSFIHFISQYYISRDMYVSYTLRRNFCWNDNAMFPEDLVKVPETKVFLSERDFIVNAPSINQYLNARTDCLMRNKFNTNLQISMFPKITHGGYLSSKVHMKAILDQI